MSLSNKTLKSFQLPDLDNVYNIPEIADEYTSKKYDVGDYVNYQGVIYRCTTQISVAEAWNGSHWTAVKIANDLRDNKNELTDLKSAVKNITDNEKIKTTGTGAFINISGSTANVNSPTTYPNCEYAVVPCSAGDVFTINTIGGASGRAYGFVASNGDVIEKANASAVLTNKVVIAPENSAYLVINGNNFPINAYYGELIINKVTKNESFIIENNDVLSLSDNVFVPYTISDNSKYIRFSTGELVSATPYSSTDYIKINKYNKLLYKRIKVTTSSPTTGMAFYDENKTYITGERCGENSDLFGYQSELQLIDVPDDAVFVRFTVITDTTVNGVFVAYGSSKIYTEKENTKKELNKIKSLLSFDSDIDVEFEIENNGYGIRFSTGELLAGSPYCTTNYIDISEFSNLSYRKIKTTTVSPTYGMAFYDATKTYISGQRCVEQASEAGYVDDLEEIKVPDDAVFARFTTRLDVSTYGDFELKGKSKLYTFAKPYSMNFQKNVVFGSFSSDWYKAQGNSYEGFTINTLYSEFIAAWDGLVSNSGGYVTKETIGTASDGQTMYCYKLVPARYRHDTGNAIVNNAPIFLTVPSIHGYEKSAAFGTYYFARDLVYNFDKNPVLNSIRTKCILYIVPVGNPYGFDYKQRKNYNGVDLNRNWGVGTDGSDDPSSPYYQGAEPFDQPETQAIKSIIDNTTNLFYVIDYHTNGQYKAASWAAANWISFNRSVLYDNYFALAYRAAQFQVAEISENLPAEYNLDTEGESIGSITIGPTIPRATIGYYALTKGVMGNTFECNNGLPSEDSPYSPIEQKVNSELIGNWVKNLLLVFSNN